MYRQQRSKEPQRSLSISSNSSATDLSTIYNSDPFVSPSSTSPSNSPELNPALADLTALEEETQIWNFYFRSPVNVSLLQRVNAYGPPLRREDLDLSPTNQNFATNNLSLLNTSDSSQDLRRSDARREPHKQKKPSRPPAPEYSLFPYIAPNPPPTPILPPARPQREQQHLNFSPNSQTPHPLHKSWPTRSSSPRKRPSLGAVRGRADTTSCLPSHPYTSTAYTSPFTPAHPSNLSKCTTLDYQTPLISKHSTDTNSNSSSSVLYMRSDQPSPLFFDSNSPVHSSREKDLEEVNEVSVFDFDDDGDDDEDVGKVEASVGSFLRKKLHIRSTSSALEQKEELGVEVRARKRRGRGGRSLSEVVRGVFGRERKTGGTV